VIFASDFGQMIPWWFYVILAVIALFVAALFIVAVGCVVVALVRMFSRDRDADGE
jgi:hypothetical protein